MPRKSVERKSLSTEYEQRTFVNPSAISPHLFCPICQEAFVNPQRAPCGHSFCKLCLEPWLENNPVCPVDRKPVPKGSLHHDFIIESIIGDYTVACPWRALGCDFIGPLHLLESHKKRCVMNPGSMPPALRDHTAALLSKWRQDAPAPCISSIPEQSATSSTQSPADHTDSSADSQSNTVASLGNDAMAHDDGLDALPPTPPPNLLFRLYQNSDNGSRELLCNFLQTSSSLSPLAAPKRRRTGRRGTTR